MAVKCIGEMGGADWHLYNGDCVEVAQGLPDESIGFTIYSPPFSSLYTFSDDPRDMSNSRTHDEFWGQYNFLIAECFRLTKPGRLVCIHCMNLPTSIQRDGYMGIYDFRGDVIRAHQKAGFIYHAEAMKPAEVVIRKDPVAAMQRTKALGLLHKQVVKDSCLSRMAIADYLVFMRKPGVNLNPVSGRFDTYYGSEFKRDQPIAYEDQYTGRVIATPGEVKYSIAVWQRYAETVWMDIDQGDVLSRLESREENDERHIAPLQLTVIRRALDMYSNEGDVVFSPFAGIGSEGYVALEMKRKFIGAELKQSYYEQAAKNIEVVAKRGPTLLDLMGAA